MALHEIRLNNVSFAYDRKIIFENINLHVPQGSTACLLGESGVGKTTLLRFLAGLEQCSVTNTDNMHEKKELTASYMEQTAALLPWLSAIDNVLIGYVLRGERITNALRERANSLLNQVGLAESKYLLPKALSGGMRQRVALVRTIMEDRNIVLMDEPFSSIDSITRVQLQRLAVSLLKDKTVLWVTHDPLEAVRVGHIVYIMGGTPLNLHMIPLPETSALPRSLDVAGSYVGLLYTRLEELGNITCYERV